MDALNKAYDEGVVIGLRKASGGVFPRIDIDELLLKHPDTFLKELMGEGVPW